MQTIAIVKTFLLAVAGGLLFYFLRIPLPWMLGPLTTVVIWTQFCKKCVSWPSNFRQTALIFLGYVVGISFTAEAAHQISIQLPIMAAATTIILIVSLLCGYLTHRQAGISFSTALMGSVPGGFSQMILLSEEIVDADVSVVSFMHTVRILSVVFVVPYLATQAVDVTVLTAGRAVAASNVSVFTMVKPETLPLLAFALISAIIANKISCPTPFFLGPILGIALISINGVYCPPLPAWLTILAQISVANLSKTKRFTKTVLFSATSLQTYISR